MSVLPVATLTVGFTNCFNQADHIVHPTSLESLDPITDRLLENSGEPGVVMIDAPCIICYDGICINGAPESVRQVARQLLVDNQQRDGEAQIDSVRRLMVAVARILLNKNGSGANLDGFTSKFVDIYGVDEGIRKARQRWLDLAICLGEL